MEKISPPSGYGYAAWIGDWTVTAHERIGRKDVAVVSVQFSVPRVDGPKPPSRAPVIKDRIRQFAVPRRTRELEAA